MLLVLALITSGLGYGLTRLRTEFGYRVLIGDDHPAIERLDRLIAQVVRSSAGRQYTSVKRSRVERCLHSSARTIEYEFDDICDSSQAGMNALQVKFKRYIWDCLR